jgi:hypothetical protein
MNNPVERSTLLDRGTPSRYQKAPLPPRRPTRTLHLSLSLLILGFLVIYSQRSGKPKSAVLYGLKDTQRPLPDVYGICTRDRQGIYTVPEEGGIGAVECLVVSGKEVVASGSLSKLT